jgi:hypothetical protein
MRTGRIYKIISGQGDECYVGSTFQSLTYRWRDHKTCYKHYKQGKEKVSYVASYDLFDKYGVDNCAIILIKEYEVCDRRHMEAYEQLWINKLNCINKHSAFRISKFAIKQYYEQNKERKKQYYEQNKDKCKEYYEQNKDKIKERKKQYHEQNKDKIKERKKQYHEQNKEKINQRKRERREQNKEVINQRKRERREQNKEVIRQKDKQYYEQNKDKINQKQRERRASKKAATIQS